MIELKFSQFPVVESLLVNLQYAIPLHGVVTSMHPGRIFVDEVLDPQTAYVWTSWGYHYLLGSVAPQAFIDALHKKLVEELLPQSAALGEPDVLLTVSHNEWEAVLDKIFPVGNVMKLYRRAFTFDVAIFRERTAIGVDLPHGYALELIDNKMAQLLSDDILATWGSLEAFNRHGLGMCLVKDGQVSSACLSAFVARGMVEIGVHTVVDERRQGFATITASGCIQKCLEAGLVPHWECFWDNVPSIGLAEKLGFRAVGDIPIYYWKGPESN